MDKQSRLRDQRLVALFLLGWVLFTYPLLSIASHNQTMAGIPIFYLFIFSVWLAFIGGVIYLVERT